MEEGGLCMAITDFYNTTAVVYRQTTSTGRLTDGVVSWQPQSTIIGALDTLDMGEQRIADKEVKTATHVYLCSTTCDVRHDDELEIDNETYRVEYPDEPLNIGRHQEIMLRYVGVDN